MAIEVMVFIIIIKIINPTLMVVIKVNLIHQIILFKFMFKVNPKIQIILQFKALIIKNILFTS